MLAANFNGGAPGKGDSAWDNVSVVPSADGNSVEVKASVSVDPLLNRIVGIGNGVLGVKINKPVLDPRVINRGATANRTLKGIELALVFDVTLSMIQDDAGTIDIVDPCVGDSSRIKAGCNGALILSRALYGDSYLNDGRLGPDNKKWLSNLFVSVVPFNVTVNYGAANTHFLDATQPAPDYAASWSGPTGWGGCLEMRSTARDDANTAGSGNGLRRYFWPSTYNAAERYDPNKTNNTSSQPFCLSNAAYRDTRNGNPSGANNVCMGHNDWTAPAYVLSGASGSGGRQNTLISTFANNSLVRDAGLNAWASAHGPNMMCPPETHQVLPLTRDRDTVEARIRAMATLPFSYGTNIAAGLQAGYFTLSPNWRKQNGFAGWQSAEPANPPDQRPTLPNLPLDYYAANMAKIMILLTDGDNNWSNARELQGTANTLVRPESRQVAGFYSAYGKLGPDYTGDDRETVAVPSNPSDVNSATTTAMNAAEARMDSEAEAWCAKIKAGVNTGDPEKISIITIGFGSGIGSRATRVLSNCASVIDGKRQYYPAPTAKDLEKIFKAIANDLARLRLSQ